MPAVHRPRATSELVQRAFGDGPVTVSAVLGAGITRGQLRAALEAGHLLRLRRGVVRVAGDRAAGEGRSGGDGDRYDDARTRHVEAVTAAHARLSSDAVISHESATVLLGRPLPRPNERPSRVRATAPGHGRRRAGIHLLDGLVAAADRTFAHGVPCTTVARTALDVACGRRLPESLVVLDDAIRLAGPDALRDAFTRLPPRRGSRELERALGYADPRSESPLESASRGHMIANGLPRAELQAWIVDDEGRHHRVDFLWRALRVVGEADGWGKYTGMEDLRAEKRREDALRACGLTVVRWTSDELWRTPEVVIARWRRALAS